MKLFFASVLFFVSACSEVPNDDSIERIEPVAEHRTGESRIQLTQVGDSCLQECGHQARSGLYTDCLTNGGEQQECGQTAREWYRECLQTECSEEEIQLDDCRTACRVEAKPSFEQCLTSGDEKTCRAGKREEIRSCLLDCET